MMITQLSVFLENKPGRLLAVVDLLGKNGIDISALSLADSEKFGVLRLIVDQPDRAKEILSESGVIATKSRVFALAMDDAPGGMTGILRVLADAGISVEYMYACVGRVSGKALMVVRVDEGDKAEGILHENGYADINPADIYRI